MKMYDLLESAHGAQVFKHKKNGLRVILMPNPVNEVAGFQVTYHVGSRDEATGYTGATHILEHLMFKGSKNFHKALKNNAGSISKRAQSPNFSTTYSQ